MSCVNECVIGLNAESGGYAHHVEPENMKVNLVIDSTGKWVMRLGPHRVTPGK